MVGALVEVFSFLGWRRGGFRAAGRWMILLGAITMMPAALSGLYALTDVTRMGIPDAPLDMSWREVVQISPLANDTSAWEFMTNHAWIMAIASVELLFVVVVWIACSDRMRSKFHVPLVLLLLFGCALVAVGAWHAGEGVYRHGVGVAALVEPYAPDTAGRMEPKSPDKKPSPARAIEDIAKDAATARGPATRGSTSSPTALGDNADAAPSEQSTEKYNLDYILPPIQAHVISAGFVASLALVSLGLAIRGASAPPIKVEGVHDIAAALAPFDTPDGGASFDPDERTRSIDRIETRRRFPGSLPPARFWMITALLGLLTAGGGLYILAKYGAGTWNPNDMMKVVYDPSSPTPITANRRLAHIIAGTSIVVFALLLAMIGRWAPRRKGLLFVFAILLLAALGAQVWLGGLLLFDSTSGPITRLN